MAFKTINEKSPNVEITKTDWNDIAENLDELWAGRLEQNQIGDFGGGWGSGIPPQWAMTFTLEHQATVIYNLTVAARIYNGGAGNPRPEAMIGVRPRLNGVFVANTPPVMHRIKNTNASEQWIQCTGFLPDLEPGTYTLDFQFQILATINFNVGGAFSHSVSFTGRSKALWEVL